MPCINKDSLQYLITYDPLNPQLIQVQSSIAIPARKEEKFDYWYCQVSCHNSFKCFNINELLPSDILDKLKNKQIFLIVDNGLEPFLKTADGIYYNLVIKEQIPESQIILMSSIPTMIDHVKNLAKQLGREEIKVEWWAMFEWSCRNAVRHSIPEFPNTLENKKYTKKFLNFNRRWRLHRPLLVTMLYDKNLLDSGYVSLGVSDFNDDNWDKKLLELRHYFSYSPEIMDILKRNTQIKDLPPMYLDTEDLVTNRADQTISTNEYYENTYFSVVTETTFCTSPGYNGVPFLSEKVFKCIAMKHPFLLVTTPNTLQYLKKLGYKTFESIIDERYDNEENDAKRMLLIVNEIDRLCNLSEDELIDWLEQAKAICDYNFDILKNKLNSIHPMN